MKITSWNVNSVRARITNIIDYIKDSKPDLLMLQEIKTEEKNFPFHNFREIGYESYVFGQKAYKPNGKWQKMETVKEIDAFSYPKHHHIIKSDKHMASWTDIKCSVTYMHLYNQFKTKYKELNNQELED